ncbi:MAG: DUF2871 domain-containing protein [Oscillospiraceae bacterium]
MKKLINTAFTYAILGMCGGVFYREFTKFNNFDSRTSLGFVHLHLLVLGMFFFLIIALFEKQYNLTHHKRFNLFYLLYNLGLGISAVTFLVRGIIQVLALNVSTAISASLSGVAGIGHAVLGVGIIFFFVILKNKALHTSKK